jgi:hypothetical protein
LTYKDLLQKKMEVAVVAEGQQLCFHYHYYIVKVYYSCQSRVASIERRLDGAKPSILLYSVYMPS